MVSVLVKKDNLGHFNGFICTGHTHYAKKGSDIVCAGISALVNTTALSLVRLLNIDLKVKQNAKKGFLDCSWANEQDKAEKSDLLVRTMLLGLAEIRFQFPDRLEIRETEV